MPPVKKDGEMSRSSRRDQRTPAEENISRLRELTRELTRSIQSFKNWMNVATSADRARVKVPNVLIQAWLHTLMGFIHSTQETHLWDKHVQVAESLIKAGMKEVVDGLSDQDLLGRAAVLPMELVSMISLKLIQDSTNTAPDIALTYSDYLDSLEVDITTKTSDRSTQQRINFLKQEIAVIKKTVKSQSSIFRAIPVPRWNTNQPAAPRSNRYQEVDVLHSRYKPAGNNNYYASGPAAKHDMGYPSAPEKYSSTAPHVYISNTTPELRIRERREHYNEGYDDKWMNIDDLDQGEFYKLSAVSPGGFRDLLSSECVSFVERRLLDFEEFERHADDLEAMVSNTCLK